MILYPAIDLKDGKCVRLVRGDMEQATIFNDHPADQARQFEQQGFEWLHLVDLNGAFAGEPVNGEAVRAIVKAVNLPIQLGGGIRSMTTAEMWIGAGISRIILGTAAVRDPKFVREAALAFPGQVAIGLDAKDSKVALEGWGDTSEFSTVEIAQRFENAGISTIIFTDIGRDGVLTGLNMEATVALAKAVSIPVIASGGLASMADIEALLAARASGLNGAITGRALYDGRINGPAALARIRETTHA